MEANKPTKKYDPVLTCCPICGSENIRLFLVDFRSNSIYRCEDCTFQFMNPQYSNQYLDEYYSSYTPSDGTEGSHHVFSFYLDIIEKFSSGKRRALDFGCGDGQFVESCKQRKWNIYGYDVDCESTARVSARTGVPIACGDFDSIDWPEKFDLITMNQVLEHVKDPKKQVSSLLQNLEVGGLLFIAVPNIRSLSSTIKTFLERRKWRKKRVGAHYASDHHLLYFSPKTLRVLLNNFDLEILYTRNGHKGLDKYSAVNRFIKKYFTEYLYRNSMYIVLARRTGN